MRTEHVNLIIFLAMVAGGVQLEGSFAGLHDRFSKLRYKRNRFRLGRYFFLLAFPLLATLFALYAQGVSAAYAFLLFAVAGTALEWLVGSAFHRVVGQRLWTYHRYSMGGYTSWLSVPLWGMAGVPFLLLVKALFPA